MTEDYILVKVYPGAPDMTWPIQQAISTGHLWVRTFSRTPIVFLIFSKDHSLKTLDDDQLEALIDSLLDIEMVQHGC